MTDKQKLIVAKEIMRYLALIILVIGLILMFCGCSSPTSTPIRDDMQFKGLEIINSNSVKNIN